MRNFSYNSIEEITMCTALPTPKSDEVGLMKSIASFEQTASDLGFLASQNIMQSKSIDPNEIGALVFLSKTPDYRGPATAMVLQNRLGIPQDCIIYDSPTGNGGFESALNLGASLLNSLPKEYALVVFGDTISKQLSDVDIRLLNFQDGATAILLKKGKASFPVVMSTMALSKSWPYFMVPSGGFRNNESFFENLKHKRDQQLVDHLHIDSLEIIASLRPELVLIKDKVVSLIDKKYVSSVVVLINLLEPRLEQELALLFQTDNFSSKIYLSSNYFPQTMASTVPLMIEMVALKKKQIPFQALSISMGEGISVNIGSTVVQESTILQSLFSDTHYTNGFVTHDM